MNHTIALAAATFVSATVTAQTRVFPQCVFWQEQPTGTTTDPSGKFVQLMWAETGPQVNGEDPVACAAWFAYTLEQALNADRVTEDTVYILVKGFGHDTVCTGCKTDSQDPVPSPCPDHCAGNFCDEDHWDCNNVFVSELQSVTAWHCPEDRYPGILGINDLDFPHDNPGDGSNRGYRHCFLTNATRPTSGPEPRLRAWMTAFVDEIERQRTVVGRQIGDPTKWHWRFDTEPYNVSGANLCYMFEQLFLTQFNMTQSERIWTEWPVPGSPGWQPPTAYPLPTNETRYGMTLDEMYEAVRVAYDWPTQANFLSVFDDEDLPEADANRDFMLFFREVMQMATDATMANCAYDVIRAKWPAHSGIPAPSCGNWDASNCDNQLDTVGWYYHVASSPVELRDQFPRGIVDHQPSYLGNLMKLCNDDNYRWSVVSQRRSGQMNCPIMYPLASTQLDAGGPRYGHRQDSAYLPTGHPDLSSDDVNHIRVLRGELEAIINSNGGDQEVVTTMWAPEIAVVDEFHAYESERTFRWLIALFRGKNIPELLLWTNTVGSIAQDAWERTRQVIKDVYAAEITNIAVVTGNTLSSDNPSLVEYTLRAGGTDEVTLDVEAVAPSEYAETYNAVVDVMFSGLAAYDSTYYLELFIECGVDTPGVTTEVQLFDWSTTSFDYVSDDVDGTVFPFYTPDHTMRRVFLHMPVSSTYINEEGEVVVRLIHTAEVPFISNFDLVQIVPVRPNIEVFSSEEESALRSDVDFDRQSDFGDLQAFAGAVAEDKPLADINHDGTVDQQDIDLFIDAFSRGE